MTDSNRRRNTSRDSGKASLLNTVGDQVLQYYATKIEHLRLLINKLKNYIEPNFYLEFWLLSNKLKTPRDPSHILPLQNRGLILQTSMESQNLNSNKKSTVLFVKYLKKK